GLCPVLRPKYHPDKQGPDVSVTEAEEHLQRFIEVNQAWKVLINILLTLFLELHCWLRACKYAFHALYNEVYAYGCRCGGEFSIGREAADEKAIVCRDTCSLSIRSQEDKLTDLSQCFSLNPEELVDVKEVSPFSLRLHPLNMRPHFNRVFKWTPPRGFSSGQ
uniref:J domain-containing protein n=1 Tax=Salmo trutta TaxID=8032 RepID=A0A674A294_SALTR